MTQQYLDKKAKTRGVTLGLLKKISFLLEFVWVRKTEL